MSENKDTLQINQPDVINTPETNWPTPLVDPAGKLKIKVENGSRGSTSDFKAMRTSRQDDVSIPEGRSRVSGEGLDGLTIKIKTNENDSLNHDTGKGDI